MTYRSKHWCWIILVTFAVVSACQSSFQSQKNVSSQPETIELTEGIMLLASMLIDSAQKSKQVELAQKIAVADFVGPDNRLSGLGEYVADKLSEQLFNSRIFPNFVERRQLNDVLQSLSKELNGYFDSETVVEYGKLIGMDAMVIGKIQDFGDRLNISGKIVQAEYGRLIAVADVQVRKDRTADTLLSKNKTATLIVSVNPQVPGEVVAGGTRVPLKNGVAMLDQLPYGAQDILVQARGYEQIRKHIVIGSPSENVSVNLETKFFETVFQIVPPDARLTVDGKAIELNTQGYAVVKDLGNRLYSYVVKAPGHEYRTGRFNPVSEPLVVIDLPTPDPFLALENKFFQKYKQIQHQQAFCVRLFSDQNDYQVGDFITLFFKAEKDCYVTIVLISASGSLTQLFPNRFHPDNRIRAGEIHRIPDNSWGFAFKAKPPVGEERIYAIAGIHPMALFDNDFEKAALTSIVRKQARDISVQQFGKKDISIQQVGKKLDDVQIAAAAECIVYTH